MHGQSEVGRKELLFLLPLFNGARISFANLDDIAVLCIFEEVLILLLLFD